MDLYDAYDRPVQGSGLHAGQEQEHTNSSDNPAKDDQSLPNPRPPLKVVVESSEADSKQHKTEYQYSYALQRETLDVQWYLFWATLLAFVAAAYYALSAKQQLDIMNQTLQEAHIQNVAQQRALLGVDGGSIPLRGGDIGIRIKNQGRMAGRIVSCHMKYEQFRSNSASLVREKDERIDSLVAPEEPFVLSFTPPEIPPLAKGERIYIRLDISIAYDDGFGTIQHISPCLSYNVAQDAWDQSCLSTYAIDLSKRLPNDIWLPPKTKK